VYVSTVEEEAFRDLGRAWMTAKDDVRQARQQFESFLPAHDVRYAGHADWGPARRRLVSQDAFGSEWQQFVLDELGARLKTGSRNANVLEPPCVRQQQWPPKAA
jgi:transposase